MQLPSLIFQIGAKQRSYMSFLGLDLLQYHSQLGRGKVLLVHVRMSVRVSGRYGVSEDQGV